jgi:DNA-binding MarR family transcriptional regulator
VGEVSRVIRRGEEDDLAHRLQRLVSRLSRELRTDSGDARVSGADCMVLFDLRRHPGSGVSALARLAGVSRSVISERVQRLEAAGLLARDKVERADRRRVGLEVTPAGHQHLQRMARERRDRMAARLETLTPQQRLAIAAAIDALDRLPEWRSPAERAADGEHDHRPAGRTSDERRKAGSA